MCTWDGGVVNYGIRSSFHCSWASSVFICHADSERLFKQLPCSGTGLVLAFADFVAYDIIQKRRRIHTMFMPPCSPCLQCLPCFFVRRGPDPLQVPKVDRAFSPLWQQCVCVSFMEGGGRIYIYIHAPLNPLESTKQFQHLPRATGLTIGYHTH